MSGEVKRVAPRVQGHVDRLRAAGLDTQAFFDALAAIKDDRGLPAPQREALYRLIAMESFVWYLEALRGAPVDRIKLVEEARKVAEEKGVLIARRSPGDAAGALARADLGTPSGPAVAPRKKP